MSNNTDTESAEAHEGISAGYFGSLFSAWSYVFLLQLCLVALICFIVIKARRRRSTRAGRAAESPMGVDRQNIPRKMYSKLLHHFLTMENLQKAHCQKEDSASESKLDRNFCRKELLGYLRDVSCEASEVEGGPVLLPSETHREYLGRLFDFLVASSVLREGQYSAEQLNSRLIDFGDSLESALYGFGERGLFSSSSPSPLGEGVEMDTDSTALEGEMMEALHRSQELSTTVRNMLQTLQHKSPKRKDKDKGNSGSPLSLQTPSNNVSSGMDQRTSKRDQKSERETVKEHMQSLLSPVSGGGGGGGGETGTSTARRRQRLNTPFHAPPPSNAEETSSHHPSNPDNQEGRQQQRAPRNSSRRKSGSGCTLADLHGGASSSGDRTVSPQMPVSPQAVTQSQGRLSVFDSSPVFDTVAGGNIAQAGGGGEDGKRDRGHFPSRRSPSGRRISIS
uniref:Uncharacterized protein n=1 Tax=Chromera velia CCMP2878 TaxID=1169474 RepID=A0A0G4I571_9ALVE|eukprot:Cvel_11107.t1-p1 / transcript=Cvel_11107.t1 / gene=Cvel_11107 / organism=Chromera_velia_CCMP2878 / gene_product=hypothetical protein / transcript_product=hypothetical protein / location=Cvel_scaffold687:38035-41329(+) / protein_length=449 / sequence_SO=supercontig / SO=protein_coding / is_pseudo=false